MVGGPSFESICEGISLLQKKEGEVHTWGMYLWFGGGGGVASGSLFPVY